MTAPAAISRLGRYQLSRVLGQGAMGVVYEGLDPLLNRQVAIKTILRSALVDADSLADSSVRFVREAQAIARLNHPHIVSVFDFGEEGDVAYFVMEFVRGRELKDYFDSGEFFDPGESVRVVCELLSALDFAHQQGVVHRDVKPANVMLDAGRRVKLTDFGVARLADSSSDRTMAGTMVGTPSYMSPEQVQGLAVGSRTDLFAVGIILYQCLTRTKPFPGPGAWAVQRQIVHDDPLPPSVVNREIDPLFDAVVARALAKDPVQRYASAAEFALDLKQALALPGAEPRAGRGAVLSTPPAVPLPHSPQSDPGEVTQRCAEATLMAERDTTIAYLPTAATVVPSAVLRSSTPPFPGQGRSARWVIALSAAVAVAASVYLYFPAGSSVSPESPQPEPGAAFKAVVPPAPQSKDIPLVKTSSVGASSEAVPTPAPVPPLSLVPLEPVGKFFLPLGADTAAPAPRVARSEIVPKARPSPVKSRTNPRCEELLQRFQLGEGLSPDDLVVLQKECGK